MVRDKLIESCRGNYESCYAQMLMAGCSAVAAAEGCAHRFLDGKPYIKGLTHFKRSAAFWACGFWQNIPAACFELETVILALGRALQHKDLELAVLERIFQIAPEALKQGIRFSQIFLRPKSTLWRTILQLSSTATDDFKMFIRVCDRLHEELQIREEPIEKLQLQLAGLTVLETLVYSSLFAYQHLIPERCAAFETGVPVNDREQEAWDVLNQLLDWKIRTRPESDFKLTEQMLAESLKQHLMPLIMPSSNSPASCKRNLDLFTDLVVKKIGKNDFWSTSITAFCFDEDYRYRFDGDFLTLFPVEIPEETAWDRNGKKLEALHRYWFNRALIDAHLSGILYQPFGKPENDNSNRFAYLKASRIFLQLVDVYGMGARLDDSNGGSFDLFKALHSLELMTAFFNTAYIDRFKSFYQDSGNWCLALHQLAMDGLLNDMQNRFPLTWAEHEEKANSIKSWTVSDHHPGGDIREARAILTLWSSDLKDLAKKLKKNPNLPVPEFHEKPILRLGLFGFQLPWLTAVQNNSTAAINNLRRVDNRRSGRSDETHCIEHRLGEQLETKGFVIVKGYQPEKNHLEDPGEIDLICFLEGHLFIFEVKSTYIRKTQHEAWLHRTNTLRKAARQLKRKQEAVTSALEKDVTLQGKLHITNQSDVIEVHTWIVDTSIEYDQEIIDGFLKVSLEALLIVLRNEQHLLRKSLMKSMIATEGNGSSGFSDLFDQYETGNKRKDDLFPQGFTARRFAEIVEGGEVWYMLDE
ncbi:MAG: NERD domain-containing protein [Proteobacteria bacterium]|nr:NERD domain-containing protein [Pseudomonadota bacterium]MBU1060540.1 NERD domain-containing protein [Pseudomonadota bacterium]